MTNVQSHYYLVECEFVPVVVSHAGAKMRF